MQPDMSFNQKNAALSGNHSSVYGGQQVDGSFHAKNSISGDMGRSSYKQNLVDTQSRESINGEEQV